MTDKNLTLQNARRLHHVFGPEEGESYWQPEPAHGYVTTKVSPHNLNTHTWAAGFQVIDPGGHIRPHAHERAEELLFVWEGHGVVVIDGVEHPVEPGSLIYVDKLVMHSVVNRSAGLMKVLWVITPPGLEDVFSAIGRPRQPGEKRPESVERPDNTQEILDRAYFARTG